jgi:transposase
LNHKYGSQGEIVRKIISPEKKAEILSYIEKYNSQNGRGGQSAAAEKFKVSRVAINNWLKQKSKGKKAVKANNEDQVAKRPGRPSRKEKSQSSDIFDAIANIKKGIKELEMALKKVV